MEEIIAWLRTPEGEQWSEARLSSDETNGGRPGRHSTGQFASLKSDHTCHYDERTGEYMGCWPNATEFKWLDQVIQHEIAVYGMNGLPE